MPRPPNPLIPRRLPSGVDVRPGDKRRLRLILLTVALTFGGCLVLASGPSREANARLAAEAAAIETASCELAEGNDGTPFSARIEFTNTLDDQAEYIVVDFEYLDVDGIAVHSGTVAFAGLALNQTGSAEAAVGDGPPELATATSCQVTSAFGL